MRSYEEHQAFIKDIKARGWGNIAAALLDALAPLGVIGAQLVYVAQPAARAFGVPGGMLNTLAATLEDPDALASIRAALEDDDEAS